MHNLPYDRILPQSGTFATIHEPTMNQLCKEPTVSIVECIYVGLFLYSVFCFIDLFLHQYHTAPSSSVL